MILPLRALVAVLALALAFPSAAAPRHAGVGYSRDAQKFLTQARAAAGGDGWGMLRGLHETGHLGAATYESWADPLRYGLRVETRDAAGAISVHGFNGQGDWRIAPGGATTAESDPKAVAQTRTEAFLAAGGYFHTSRFDARADLMGVRNAGGKAYDVVAIEPFGGAPRELWFNRADHLLARIVDRTGAKPVVTDLSDYRKVGPVRVPFRATVEGAAPGSPGDRRVDTVIFTPADRALFSLPRPAPAN